MVEPFADEVEAVAASAERSEQELQNALARLKHAMREPLGVAERIRDHPMPWVFAGILVGVWFGTRRRRERLV